MSDDISELSSFTASLSGDKLLLDWTPYPDPDRLKQAENTMDISLRDAAGNVLVEAWGNRLFDWSWVYGPIRYKARISKGGTMLAELASEEDSFETDASELEEDTEYEACGFYAFDISDRSSNEICVKFRTPKTSKPEPEPSAEPTPDTSPTPEPESGDGDAEPQPDN